MGASAAATVTGPDPCDFVEGSRSSARLQRQPWSRRGLLCQPQGIDCASRFPLDIFRQAVAAAKYGAGGDIGWTRVHTLLFRRQAVTPLARSSLTTIVTSNSHREAQGRRQVCRRRGPRGVWQACGVSRVTTPRHRRFPRTRVPGLRSRRAGSRPTLTRSHF